VNAEDSNRYTPLVIAVQYSHVGMIQLLIDHPMTDINHNCGYMAVGSINGETLLMLAISTKREVLLQMLLSRDDTTVQMPYPSSDTTLLRYVVCIGYRPTLELLTPYLVEKIKKPNIS